MINNKKQPAKMSLINTLEILLQKKTFQKISVNELCELAEVSRSAFYANFEDKYQMLSYCLSEKTDELNTLMAQHPPQEFFTVMLDFIQEKDRFFYHTFGADFNEELGEILYQFFNQHFTKILKEKASTGFPLPGPIDAVAAFYIGGLTTMVFRWVKSNYKMSKKELAACQYHLLQDIL